MKLQSTSHKTSKPLAAQTPTLQALRTAPLSAPSLEVMTQALALVGGGAKAAAPEVLASNKSALPDTELALPRDEGPAGDFVKAAVDRTLDAMAETDARQAKAEGGIPRGREQLLLGLVGRSFFTHAAIVTGSDENLKGKPDAVIAQRQELSRAFLAELIHQVWTSVPVDQAIDRLPAVMQQVLDPKTPEAAQKLSDKLELAFFKQQIHKAFRFIDQMKEEGMELGPTEKSLLTSAKSQLDKNPEGAAAKVQALFERAQAYQQDPYSKKAQGSMSAADFQKLKKQWAAEAQAEPGPTPEQMVQKGLVRLAELEGSVTDAAAPTVKERFEGAMIGLAIGDALGGPTEFMSREDIFLTHGLVTDMVGGGWLHLVPGEYTDDTQMAERMANSIVEKGGFDAEDVGARFVEWLNTDPKDVGNLTRQALELKRVGVDAATSGAIPWMLSGYENAGNGSVMRAAPVALLTAFEDLAGIEAKAMASSAVTHADPRCTHGTAAIAYAVSLIMNGEEDVLPKVVAYLKDKDPITAKAIAEVPKLTLEDIRTSGYVVDTVQAAFWTLHHAKNYVDGIVKITNLGEDTDTAGATAGILLGAKFGIQGIPNDWQKTLQKRDFLVSLARKIHDLALPASET